MSELTWRSTWLSPVNGLVDVQLLPGASNGVVSISSLPIQLKRPASDAAVPCQVSLHWLPQPLRCHQLQLEVICSARHVELYAEGMRRTMLGEEKQSEVYLGTFRGTKLTPKAQHFTIESLFKQSDRNCEILKSLSALKITFVSLSGEKNVLDLQHLKCNFLPMDPVSSASDLATSMAKVDLEGVSNVQMILEGFRQTLEREIDVKIAQAIDTKLATLLQRLSASEQALLQLHNKMDAKDVGIQASLAQIQRNHLKLENQFTHFKVVEGANTKFDTEILEETSNVDFAEAETTSMNTAT